MARPVTLAAPGGVALLATLSGLFDGDGWLRPVPRFGQWPVMAAATCSAAWLGSTAVRAVGMAVPPVVLALN